MQAQHIGNACYGLKNLEGSYASTQALVHALTKKIQDSDAALDAQHIGNACYGLKQLDGRHASTHALVGALTRKIQDSDTTLNAQHIGNACYGLKNLDGNHVSTKNLVGALTKKIQDSDATLNAQHIGNACYGLKNLNGRHDSTQVLVAALAKKIQNSDATLDTQHIGTACYGLQQLDGNHVSTQALVDALSKKVLASQAQLNGQEIGNACYGLKQLDWAIVDELVNQLFEKFVNTALDLGAVFMIFRAFNEWIMSDSAAGNPTFNDRLNDFKAKVADFCKQNQIKLNVRVKKAIVNHALDDDHAKELATALGLPTPTIHQTGVKPKHLMPPQESSQSPSNVFSLNNIKRIAEYAEIKPHEILFIDGETIQAKPIEALGNENGLHQFGWHGIEDDIKQSLAIAKNRVWAVVDCNKDAACGIANRKLLWRIVG